MKNILIATSNPGKLDEIRLFLSGLPVKLLGLSDVGLTADAPETGVTFKENAIEKARYYFRESGLPSLADDGGLEIDALDGAPGVHSHRWAKFRPGDDGDDAIIRHTLAALSGVPAGKRGAQLRVVVALVLPDGSEHFGEGTVRGIIAEKPAAVRTKGYPYRSLLYLPEIRKFYNHELLTPRETEKYNHRKRALRTVMPAIRNWLTHAVK
ncbi:hypothetical protein A2Z33_02655 [Candidatus Gottesmanbacteria bacterium RBG_16_52_11]|uniref:Non-canonical purine NTP pyrophosphatase n=1 Tax=Candidatus Gottesmanbacteria bacterium RBG_16_52_11 TaxID=1798374 RepID=A0A1F5YMT0_9BACT|nr:MAG: hypothetical protein A2Z33_02655 [Candidatus Gottesmanbacteria bacterium RBG_16_52_11]